MSQENRFCAEIYARLFTSIDHSKRKIIIPDGQVTFDGFPQGSAVPDLCFTLKGFQDELRIEAKILKDPREVQKRVHLQPSQMEQWQDEELAHIHPHLWAIATADLGQCWLVFHKDIIERLREKAGANGVLNMWPNTDPPESCDIDALANAISSYRAVSTEGSDGE